MDMNFEMAAKELVVRFVEDPKPSVLDVVSFYQRYRNEGMDAFYASAKNLGYDVPVPADRATFSTDTVFNIFKKKREPVPALA